MTVVRMFFLQSNHAGKRFVYSSANSNVLGLEKRRMICAVASGRRWSPGYCLKPDAFLDTPFPQTHLTYSHHDESYMKGMKGGQISGLACQDDVLFFPNLSPSNAHLCGRVFPHRH